MVDRSGLFVAPLPGATPQGSSPTDGRLVLGALFGSGAGCVSGGALSASSSLMQVTVGAAVWRIPDPAISAAVFLSPADLATLTFSAGPASGSRIDVIWVRQNNFEAGDANSRVVYGVASGTAASSPVAPAIPAGAIKIGQLTVPAGVSNTAACTLVPSYPAAVERGDGAALIAWPGTVTNYGGQDQTLLRRVAGIITFYLATNFGANGMATGAVVCTLPTGYRPAGQVRWSCPNLAGGAWVAPAGLVINAAGQVIVDTMASGGGAANGAFFGGISFPVAP